MQEKKTRIYGGIPETKLLNKREYKYMLNVVWISIRIN
jgi:hypothetical protein